MFLYIYIYIYMVLVLVSGTDTSPFIEIKETSYGFLRESDFLCPSKHCHVHVSTRNAIIQSTFHLATCQLTLEGCT